MNVSGIVGEIGENKENKEYYIWTHKKFDIGHNGKQIVDVNLTSDAKVKLEEGVEISFSYEVRNIVFWCCFNLFYVIADLLYLRQFYVCDLKIKKSVTLVFCIFKVFDLFQVKWHTSNIQFEDRFDKYLDPNFFQHRVSYFNQNYISLSYTFIFNSIIKSFVIFKMKVFMKRLSHKL